MIAEIVHELGLCFPLQFPVLPPLEENTEESDEGTEEFAAQFDTRVRAGHRFAGHGEGLLAKEVFPKSGAGEIHFEKAGGDGQDEIPKGKSLLNQKQKCKSDDRVKEKPKCGVESGIVERRVRVDLWVNIVPLKPGKNEEESGEGDVDWREEDFHISGIAY